MLSYIARRLMLVMPTLLGITLLVFFVMVLSPGSVSNMMQNQMGDMRAEDRKRIEEIIRKRYGLNDPYIVQYGRWLNHISPIGFKETETGWPGSWTIGLKTPDLGESIIRRRPVLDLVLERLPVTLLLNLLAIPIVYMVAITAGIFAARHRGRSLDVGSGTLLLALYSMPVMWIGVMLLGFFASRDYWQWFPTGGMHDIFSDSMNFLPRHGAAGWERGWLLDTIWHLVLPVICLTYGGFAFLSKLMRASVLENLTADFARTARAKGLSENRVLFRHVLANSLLPLITVAASILPGLMGGSLIVESIFSLDGMGRLMIDAIKMKDQELVLSETCVVAAISLLSLIVADVMYAVADPRVAYE